MSIRQAVPSCVLAVVVMFGGSVAVAQAAPVGAWAQRRVSTDVLESVSAVSSTRVWAVGYYKTAGGISRALVLNRRGATWSAMTTIPNPSSTDNKLFGVSASSSSNAWAVGYYRTRAGLARSLILRWKGNTWSRSGTRDLPTSDNELTAVATLSKSDAWAVGYYSTRTGSQRSLILHWNGTGWSRTRIGSLPSSANQLTGVVIASSTSAWAVGDYGTGTGSQGSLILRWNGTRWTRGSIGNLPATANQLTGVAATSGSTAAAVGANTTSTNTSNTMILHGDGTRWAHGASPNPSRLINVFNGVSAASASDAWAVGEDTDNRTALSDALIAHWNGRTWSQTPVQGLPSADNSLTAVSAVSPTGAWAVGYSCTNAACSTANTMIVTWNGTAWHPVPSPNLR